MNLSIDKNSKTPAYSQIEEQVTRMVRDGLLPPGTKIPSVRQLSRILDLSKNTISLAFDALAAKNIIETRHGSGTYISEHAGRASRTNLRTREEVDSPLKDAPPMGWDPYKFRSDYFGMPVPPRSPNMVRFTQASPDPELFPFERIKQVATNMLWYPQEFFFDVGHPQGYQPLVEHLEKDMSLSGVAMAEGENDIIIMGGFQRALALVLDFILAPGQKVAIESPSYSGILNNLIAKRIGFVPIPMDKEGMDTEYLAGVLKRNEVQAIITIPTYHNPTGITMSEARREHLLQLAVKHRVPVIEDDWGRLLRFDGPAPPPLKSIDPGGYVIHIGTFSKIFLPGLRIGWITSPSEISVQLLRAKMGADSGDSFFLQVLLDEMIKKGHFHRHLRRSLKEYRKRRDTMCTILDECLPSGCRFMKPQGGFSVWVELPEKIKSMQLLSLAREEGVDFVPSAFLMPDRRDTNAFRLSFSRNSIEDITMGIRDLCGVIQRCIDDPAYLDQGATTYEELYR